LAPKLVLVGRVAGAFGVKGELRITAYTEDPTALLLYGVMRRKDGTPALTLSAGRVQKGALIARAAEAPTREAAEALKGAELYVPREALPQEDEDEFYLVDLIGLKAVAPDGSELGRVKSVQNFGAGDLLEIELEAAPSWWAPFTKEAVPKIDLEAGVLTIVRPSETE
jgi:16S rRNA processing protein RimM